jgi:branched chain amino acid efflux pump
VAVYAGGGVASAVVAAALLNARYVPIGLSVAPSLEGHAFTRLVHGQLVVDESWAVASTGDGRYDRRLLLTTGLVLYVAWIAGTTIGAVGARFLGDPKKLGLDAAFPALFLALVVPQLRNRRAVAAAALGGVIAIALIPVSPPGVPIIGASAACLIGLKK